MATAKAEASFLLFAVHWLSGGTQQIGVCPGILRGAPTNLISGSRSLASKASRCSSVRSPPLPLMRDGLYSDGRCHEQEHLWQEFFLDPTMWWDNRRDEKSSRSPDFRRKGSGEVLWLNNMFKPAWVDELLVTLDMQIGHGASPPKSSSPGNPEPGRRAGSEMGSRCSSVRSPALPHPMGHGASPFESSNQDKPEPGRRAGSEMSVLTAVTLSTLCQQGKLSEAVGALESLAQTDSAISVSLFCTVLKLCTAHKDLAVGRRVHDLTVKFGYESNAYLGNHILRMYASGGRLQEAMDVFNRVGKPSVYMWFSIISAHAKHGKPKEAIQLYREMRRSGVKANGHVFVAALQACAFAADLESGRKVHHDVVQSGVPTNLFVGSSLVDMYAKCGGLKDARHVFNNMATKDVVTWNALIAGYAKCGELKDARQVFDSMDTKDVVTWNALIAGYAQQGLGQEALVVYGQMEAAGLILADHFTFACLLKACATTGALQKGMQLHSQIVEQGLLDNVVVGTCLVDMYAKCGELEDARQVFDSLNTKNVVTWNALIAGYGACDEGRKALASFEEMLVAGVHPNDVTFTCVLVACSHEGLVQEGRKCLSSMAEHYGMEPTVEHYNCMIDLLGRAGQLDEAAKMILLCEGQSNVVGLTSLLNACKSHGDIERAVWCFESIVRLDPQMASAYVLMANAYADAGRWTDVDRIETQRRAAGANKKPAAASIEVNKEVHRFLVGERRNDVALKVESTNARVKQEGGHVHSSHK